MSGPIDSADLEQIANEAYTYLYPLVTMEISRRQLTNGAPGSSAFHGPMNFFVHVQAYPTADFREVVRPNFDTLYSSTFLDLTDGPVVLGAPDTDGRYYMLPMLDMWTDVFAVPGKRTSGTGAGQWAIVPSGWAGKLPVGLDRIDAPTPYVWIIGRTQTNGPDDYDAVHQVQAGYTLTRLDGSDPAPKDFEVDETIDMKTEPLSQVNSLSAEAFFTLAAELLKLHPPHATDWSTVARIARIGVVPGESFDWKRLDPAVHKALDAAPKAAVAAILGRVPTMASFANGWEIITDSIGVYGNYYMKRAIVSMIGLGANPAEDAVYPLLQHDADGDALDGANDYVIHFASAGLPPVDAFWSITMYDAAGFQVANELDRFAIGDRDALVYNADGSLDLYFQHADPGPDKVNNWLPAPKGPLGITMRLYSPKPAALDGTWTPPPVKKV